MSTTSIFWMVYRDGGLSPTVRHDTRDSAEAEAARIARLHPGIAVYVLEATHRIQCELTPCTRITLGGAVAIGCPF